MKSLFVTILLLSSPVMAATFAQAPASAVATANEKAGTVKTAKEKSKAPNASKSAQRSTANDVSESAAVETLRAIAVCAKSVTAPQTVQKCTEGMLSKELNPHQSVRLLAWFAQPIALSYPQVCPEEATELLPKEQVDKAKIMMCSDYSQDGLKRKAIFFLTLESGQVRLFNIKQ